MPPACVRKGAYVAPNVVFNAFLYYIGAYVDSGTLVDTWATVGSCTQLVKMSICWVALGLEGY